MGTPALVQKAKTSAYLFGQSACPLTEFRLLQLEELKALVVEREALRIAADEAACALARVSGKIELYLKGLPGVLA